MISLLTVWNEYFLNRDISFHLTNEKAFLKHISFRITIYLLTVICYWTVLHSPPLCTWRVFGPSTVYCPPREGSLCHTTIGQSQFLQEVGQPKHTSYCRRVHLEVGTINANNKRTMAVVEDSCRERKHGSTGVYRS